MMRGRLTQAIGDSGTLLPGQGW